MLRLHRLSPRRLVRQSTAMLRLHRLSPRRLVRRSTAIGLHRLPPSSVRDECQTALKLPLLFFSVLHRHNCHNRHR
jgi:hypothetical protein